LAHQEYKQRADGYLHDTLWSQTKVRTHVDKGEKIGTATSEEQRGFVIYDINMGNTYATVVWDSDANTWNLGAKVQVVVIESEKFIKNKADNIKKDNLDNLPSFQLIR
jgi:hypothetical protein